MAGLTFAIKQKYLVDKARDALDPQHHNSLFAHQTDDPKVIYVRSLLLSTHVDDKFPYLERPMWILRNSAVQPVRLIVASAAIAIDRHIVSITSELESKNQWIKPDIAN